MDRFAALTGRQYKLFDYHGAPDAERVVILMGSGGEMARELVDDQVAKGEKIGVLQVRLFRPFSVLDFISAIPETVKQIAVLDRTKEPGCIGEPLYLDVIAALNESWPEGKAQPKVVGGRYGLSSKEFTPAMLKSVFDEIGKAKPKNHFTVGIVDDVTHTSLEWDADFSTEDPDTVRCLSGWTRRRRYGRRQQELDQDHQRRYGQLRTGLLRIRLEEVGLGNDIAPAIRSAADPIDLSDFEGKLRRLSSVLIPAAVRHAGRSATGRDVPANSPYGPK